MRKCDFCAHDKGPYAKDRFEHCKKCHQHDKFQLKRHMTPRMHYEWRIFTGSIPTRRRDPNWRPSNSFDRIANLRDAVRKAFATSLETASDYTRTAYFAREHDQRLASLEFASKSVGITEALEYLYSALKDAGCEDIVADFVSSGDI